MLVKFRCPDCESESNFSLAQPTYTGPYRCWKCKSLFTVQMENGVMTSCLPLSQQEFDRQQEAAKQAKARGF